jgi:2-polyprenyl-6-methoxyphenol hydroxylase-like FAD-dependent oxidoreductase
MSTSRSKTATSPRRAIVIGAGIGGLTAARALADHFGQVVVLERDALPAGPSERPGTPQGRHIHVLLAGGLHALEALFPGFERELADAGAVPYRAGLDIRIERPGFDPFPQRDLGFTAYSMTRSLLEWLVRRRVQQTDRIELRGRCRALRIVPSPDGASAAGVVCETAGGAAETLEADLVVDASGRGTFCVAFLEGIGRTPPAETEIGVDVGYATAIFTPPADPARGWKGLMHMPVAPHQSRGAFVLPIEGERWIVGLGGRGEDKPPGEHRGFLDFTREFRTRTVLDALHGARPDGEVVRFAFPSSVWRHYTQLERFPRGLLPFADAICRFNPLYGQGMSVAAMESCALRDLLGAGAGGGNDPLDTLASAFFARADEIIETPWAMSVLPDFMYPQTVGERPGDLDATLKFGAALNRLAATDPEVHKLTVEVQHLLKPRSDLRKPLLVARVMLAAATG